MDPTKQPFSTSESTSDAPPPYTSPLVWGSNPPSISDKAPHANNNLTYEPPSTAYPTPSHTPGPRLLHIYKPSLLSSNLTILAPNKITTAYTVEFNRISLFSSKPAMRIYRGVPQPTNPDAPIGAVTFHTTTRSMDLTLPDRRITISHHGVFRSRYEFSSAIGDLRWKSSGGFGKINLVCETTSGGEWVAKFDAASFAVRKIGKFEIVSWEVDEEVVDEIVVSGLAVVEQVRRQSHGSASGGTAAMSGGVSAGC